MATGDAPQVWRPANTEGLSLGSVLKKRRKKMRKKKHKKLLKKTRWERLHKK
jgi:hypothetical protein